MVRDEETARRVQAAARNNAELCDLVCRGHGVVGSFAADAWTSALRTPPHYPDAVTLGPVVDVGGLLLRIDPSAGASIKDSVGGLDLAPSSFRVLFSAEWIYRPADSSVGSERSHPVLSWASVAGPEELVAWESAWSADGVALGTFVPALLDAPELVFLRGEVDGAIVAGAVVNRSGSVVGVSNLFTSTFDPVAVWADCVREISTRFPGLAIVGYESGPALAAACRAGFQSIGPLRVWITD